MDGLTIFALLLAGPVFALSIAAAKVFTDLASVRQEGWIYRTCAVAGIILTVVAFLFSRPMFENYPAKSGPLADKLNMVDEISNR